MRQICYISIFITAIFQANSGMCSTITFDHTNTTISDSNVLSQNSSNLTNVNIINQNLIYDFTRTRLSDHTIYNEQRQLYINFQGIFGSNANQIPFNSNIQNANLVFHVSAYSPDHVGQISIYQIIYGYIPYAKSSGGPFWNTELQPDSIVATNNMSNLIMTFDVTSSLQKWSFGAPNLGWDLSMNHQLDLNNQGATIIGFFAEEQVLYDPSYAGYAPKLVVNYAEPIPTPEPSSMLLLSSGFVGLLCLNSMVKKK